MSPNSRILAHQEVAVGFGMRMHVHAQVVGDRYGGEAAKHSHNAYKAAEA